MMVTYEFGDRRKGRFKNCCVAEHDRFNRDSVMVWSGISYGGSTHLYVIRNGSVTSVRCHDEILLPILRLYTDAIDDGFILMAIMYISSH